MHSIRKRLGIIMIFCTVISITISTFFVNIAINNTFNKYIINNQNERNNKIVAYFKDIYLKDKKWTQDSGKELIHEAHMGDYCITLSDNNKKILWAMDPKDLTNNDSEKKGVYKSNTFKINVDNKTVGYVIIGQYSPLLLSQSDINFKMSINKSMFLSVLLAVVITIILSLITTRQFAKPIKLASEASVNLSNGDYNTELLESSSISELSKLMKSIEILRKKLENQDGIRRRLVSDISHEIRTPLNILQNNLEAMLDGVFPVNEERLNYINEEVIRFGKLLNNLNSLKEFEQEKVNLKLEKVSLSDVINSVCKEYYIDFSNKSIKLKIDYIKNKEFMVLGDKDKLKQVFINIISNSIKFTKENGNVWISIRNYKDKILVVVEDDGIGIKKEDIPYIFERFYRGDKSREKIKGNGVGLTVVKNILRLHSAKITVESEVDIGTTFKLYFNKI